MNTWKAAAATLAVVAFSSTAVWAQPEADPNAPPPAASDPAMTPSGEGSSTGETGVTSPSGSPNDPTTNENQQPGMSPQNPTDPATSDNPNARVPTSPPGTGTSSP